MSDEKNKAVVASEPTDLQRDLKDLEVWDMRMTRAHEFYGLTPHPIIYRLISDHTMLDLTTYPMMMPTDIVHWSHGKRAEAQRRNAGGFHVFEAATNMSPSVVWLGVTNSMAMQINVMSHAVSGHVSLCAINFLNNADTAPETALSRFAMWKNKIQKLIRDPRWGWDGVEYILDAAFALENHSGWLPRIEGVPSDQELREQLEEEADVLRERIKLEGEVSVAEGKVLKKKLTAIEAQLSRHPIKPTDDLMGFLIDPANTPHLQPEARMMLDIVRERARYLQPVGRTKFMHEGWSSYWEKVILQSPFMKLPFEYAFDLAKAWSMHDSQVATRFYTDPYAMGVRVWNFIDKKFGFDEGEVEIEVPLMARDEQGFLYETEETEKVMVAKRNRDKFFEIARTYEDNRFLNEFLGEELLEEINQESLNWVLRCMNRINGFLASQGWGANLIFDPLPVTLGGLLQVIQAWMQEAEQAEYYHQNGGTPLFPVPGYLMENMAQVLQIVMGFDKNKHAIRQQLVQRTGAHWLPNIYVADDGRDTDGVLTLEHKYNPKYGQLKETECRDTLKYFRRLYGRPVRLMTFKQAVDRQGNPVGDPYPFEYFIEKDTVKERKL